MNPFTPLQFRLLLFSRDKPNLRERKKRCSQRPLFGPSVRKKASSAETKVHVAGALREQRVGWRAARRRERVGWAADDALFSFTLEEGARTKNNTRTDASACFCRPHHALLALEVGYTRNEIIQLAHQPPSVMIRHFCQQLAFAECGAIFSLKNLINSHKTLCHMCVAGTDTFPLLCAR